VQFTRLSRAVQRTLLGAGALIVVCGALPLVGSAQPASSYAVPRTAWGDPDLQGKWPGTDMVGVPMQRDEKLGLRNVLTDEEFAERERRAAQQEEQDNADFELEKPRARRAATSAGPCRLLRIGSNAASRNAKHR
jgi:hypothetical protein